MSRLVWRTIACAVLVLTAAPALAWHVAGTVYCDRNGNHVIDAGDGKLSHVTVRATSQVDRPGTTFGDLTDSNGYHFIRLPDDVDTYAVTLVGLPAGQSIRLPGGGSYTITLDFRSDHRDGVNFLVEGCAPTPTTTLVTQTTTTTRPTSTTTTTLRACPSIPFVFCEGGKINNNADLHASVAASAPGAVLRLSQDAFMSDGTAIVGDGVELGDGASVAAVAANTLKRGQDVTIRDGVTSAPPLPLAAPCCPIPDFTCGETAVLVKMGETQALAPGVYGHVRVMNGGHLELAPGTYTVCSLQTGREATVQANGAVTLNVEDTLRVGVDSHLEPLAGQPPLLVNVAGTRIKFTQNAVVRALVSAPNAQIRLGRSATVDGQLCLGSIKTDKQITLQCQ